MYAMYVEYLSPEFVFNQGHDHSADIWALGIMIYEFYLSVTPFAPKRADNITELFSNIAALKTNTIKIPTKLNEKAQSPAASDLILALLTLAPSDRLGVHFTNAILEHEYFNGFDIDALENGSMVPVYVPAAPSTHAPVSSLPAIKAYKGNQSLFDFF
jgi:serine/threonine protein kinase